MAYGIYTFGKEVKGIEVEEDGVVTKNFKGYLLLGLKGFLLNLANPFVIFYWFSVMTLGAKDTAEDETSYSMVIFIASILITFFAIDFLKIIGAKSLRPLVTGKLLKALNALIGIVFVAFAMVLIAQGVLGLMK